MKNNNLIYATAGLLHDIGKFAQRADGWYEKSMMLSEESKKLAGMLCNTSQAGYPTHLHVLWTNEFIKVNESKFANAGLSGNIGQSSLINLASYHHKPATAEQAIITLADHWSSGLDRNTDRSLLPNPEYGKDKFRSTPLVSVFGKLSTEVMPGGIKEEFGYTLQKFNTGETIFPLKTSLVNNKPYYKNLWEEFLKEFKNLPDANASNFIFSLLHLLKIYTWYIPASTMDYPDSSLFEHLKTTGAIAHCLAAYRAFKPEAFTFSGNRLKPEKDNYPLLLFCGDISGIQSFIYNVSNKSAMKGLKGRSFYVQLLAETMAAEVTEACNASAINIIYAAGGKFYVLLPNTPEIIKELELYNYKLQQKIWDKHKGSLSVNMSWIAFGMHQQKGSYLKAFTADNNEGMPVGKLWKLLAEKTSEKKKFQHVLTDRFSEMFEPTGAGGNVKVCAVSGEELPDNAQPLSQADEDETEINLYVSQVVNEQIDLGRDLYDAKYLVELMPGQKADIKIASGTGWKLNDDGCEHNVNKWLLVNWQRDIILIPPGSTHDKNEGLGFKLFGGIRMAASKNKIKTLEELCNEDRDEFDKSEDEPGRDYLGVLRMDVDNLGNLFMKGFSKKNNDGEMENHASFSALATLSALLDQFFSGYLNTIRDKEVYKSNINIVYAGGDDVFAVGRWDKLIDFGIEIRKAFQQFVCGRTDISLSAGLTIVRPKFPIAKAADMSGEAESKAKNYSYKKDEKKYLKNAINLFGISLNWEHEMPFVIECKNDLVNWIANDKLISKGFLMKMFDYYELFKRGKPGWQWQSAYNIARMAKADDNKAKRECYNTIKQLLYTNNYKNQHTAISFHAFIAACRWAELGIKNLKNGNNE
ncbi:type III-A CRISPR-associated protein Cas10/Csm1 [Parafilimonas sp.]|uniref:type III-A CRISPR-associated protein Cas10/Csm1 n=1 Tax=Parafilimonas sp. TaxID=1969739 RepID=UPI0039E3703D